MPVGSRGGGREAFLQWLRTHRDDVAVLAPVLALTLAYFYPLWTSADVIYGGLDITRQFYLFKQAAVAALRSGHLPLWLPELYCGMPLLGALIDTPFHPWDLAAALLGAPLPVIFNVGLLLHLLAGQVGAYVWVRQDTGRRRAPAVLASLWIWNPFVLNSIITGDHNNVRALLLVPAILAALERALDRRRHRIPWLTYGVLQALQLLCSGLQYAAYTLAVGALTAAGTLWARRRWAPRYRVMSRARWWLAATAFALVLPAAQLAPGFQFSLLSVRGQADVAWSQTWGISPALLLSYAAPFIYRPGEMLLYWGIAPLWLALVGAFTWRHPRRRWYLAILVGALVLCIGSHWSVSAWLNGLPILRRFRGPFRIALFANLMLARFAAGGLETTLELIERRRHRLRWRLAAQRGAVIVAFMIAGAVVWWPTSPTFSTWRPLLLTAPLWAATGLAIIALGRYRSHAWLAVLGIVAVADLSVHLERYWRPDSLAPFQSDATVARVREALDGHRVWLRGTPEANYLSLFGIETVAGHHAFPVARAAAYARALDLDDGRLLRLADTELVLTYFRVGENGRLGPPIESPREVEVRRLRGPPVPRYRVQGAARWLPDAATVWEVMRSRDYEPAESHPLLEGAPPVPLRPAGDGGTAVLEEADATHRVVHVTSRGPGYLVMANTWYPGWRATVNGRAAPIHRANYLFQAVPVESGESLVELRYRPTAAHIGILTSLLALLLLVLATGVARARDAQPAL